jgi:hypothetical protein
MRIGWRAVDPWSRRGHNRSTSLAFAAAMSRNTAVTHFVAAPLCGPGTNAGCGNLVVGNPLWLEILVAVLLVAGIVAACIAFWRTLRRG